jgi:hypothetical protein
VKRHALFALFAIALLLGARCTPPGPPPGPCGERKHVCDDEAGLCCWDGEDCCDVEGSPACCAHPYVPPEPYYGKDVYGNDTATSTPGKPVVTPRMCQ